MTENTDAVRITIYDEGGNGQIAVELESFLQFNNLIDLKLDSLVNRWRDWGTPRTLRKQLWQEVR